MPISSAGQISRGRACPARTEACPALVGTSSAGVTLIEMMMVVGIVGLLAAITYPSVASGVDTLRLRSQADAVASFFNTALARADLRNQAVQILVLPAENAIIARTEAGLLKRLDFTDGVRIARVLPELPDRDPAIPRRFLLYPGGAPPRAGVILRNMRGRQKLVRVDPLTGAPVIEDVR